MSWLAAVVAGGCWAYSLSTRFTDILVDPRLDKLFILASLIPISLLLSGWLFHVALFPFFNQLKTRKILVILGINCLITGLLFFAWYQPPPFPELHTLTISVLDDKNPLSEGFHAGINTISSVSLPDGKQMRIPVNELELKGTWQGANNGYGMLGDGRVNQTARLERFMQAGLAINLATG
ncbi:MAG TPA: hypothetical protein VMW28_02610, partial [Pelolinea sp.]|nr:hypothetical protein [Pelolinea sp.]